jgi:hypothetical protein
LTRLDISSNSLVGKKGTGRYETVDHEGVGSDEEEEIMEPDFSGKGLGISGAIMLSAFLPKCM